MNLIWQQEESRIKILPFFRPVHQVAALVERQTTCWDRQEQHRGEVCRPQLHLFWNKTMNSLQTASPRTFHSLIYQQLITKELATSIRTISYYLTVMQIQLGLKLRIARFLCCPIGPCPAALSLYDAVKTTQHAALLWTY